MKEMIIASNMIAVARNHKEQAKKRSAMLRMIMPLLSKETGDKLASAISKQDSRHFIKLWDHIKHEITHKLDKEHRKHHHTATASAESTYADVTTFQRDDETSISITTYGPRKIRISMNGNTVLEAQPNSVVPPAVAAGEEVPTPACPSDQDIGVSPDQLCKLVKMVCERLIMQADPCPLPPLMKMPGNCAEHDWPDCKVCLSGLKGFDFNANILELYDKLCASSI